MSHSTEFNLYKHFRDLVHHLAKPGGRSQNELANLLGRSPNQMSAVLRTLRTGPNRIVRVCGRRPDAWSRYPVYIYELTPEGMPDVQWDKAYLSKEANAARMVKYRKRKKEALERFDLIKRELRQPEHDQRARHLQSILTPALDAPPQHAYPSPLVTSNNTGAPDGHHQNAFD